MDQSDPEITAYDKELNALETIATANDIKFTQWRLGSAPAAMLNEVAFHCSSLILKIEYGEHYADLPNNPTWLNVWKACERCYICNGVQDDHKYIELIRFEPTNLYLFVYMGS